MHRLQVMSHDTEVVSFEEMFARLEGPWQPRVVAAMNETLFKVAWIEGEFVWHQHDDTDEAFLVMEGTLLMDLEDRTVEVGPGEMYVVPAGTQHRPRSEAGCRCVVIEPEGVRNTGESENERTVETDVWLV